MVNRKAVLEKLRTVVDPELGINIVDLGMVYEIKLKAQSSKLKAATQNAKRLRPKVYILMTLTSPGCPLAGVVDHLVREAIRELGVADVELSITFDPPWSSDMMSEEAKAQLGFL